MIRNHLQLPPQRHNLQLDHSAIPSIPSPAPPSYPTTPTSPSPSIHTSRTVTSRTSSNNLEYIPGSRNPRTSIHPGKIGSHLSLSDVPYQDARPSRESSASALVLPAPKDPMRTGIKHRLAERAKGPQATAASSMVDVPWESDPNKLSPLKRTRPNNNSSTNKAKEAAPQILYAEIQYACPTSSRAQSAGTAASAIMDIACRGVNDCVRDDILSNCQGRYR